MVASLARRLSRSRTPVMRPFWMLRIRSESEVMNSRFCSTTISDMFHRFFSASSVSMISSMIDGWMPSVGSSSNMSFGLVQRQRASASNCCSPPGERAAAPVEQTHQPREIFQHRIDHGAVLLRRRRQPHAQVLVGRSGREISPCPAARAQSRGASAHAA